MRIALILAVLLELCGLPALAAKDNEASLVKKGVLGTVNVLRELDVTTGKNRVTVTSNVEGKDSTKPEDTIDASGKVFRPQVDPLKPFVLTYTLPGWRTVSSLVIQYEYADTDAPDTVRLEGSADGGQTWFEVFRREANKGNVLKCFKPAKVNALRLILTQERDAPEPGTCLRHILEVFVYADPETPLPLSGGKDSGAFSFLRHLAFAGKVTEVGSPDKSAVWARLASGTVGAYELFQSKIEGGHGPVFGEGTEVGKRLYLRFDLDQACPMNFGVIGCLPFKKGEESWILAGASQAEIYTANGHLDPSTLKGSSIKDLTGQGWILQKAWDKDPEVGKAFSCARPGKYNQILLVWDCKKKWENNRFGHLEVFGVDELAAGNAPGNPQN